MCSARPRCTQSLAVRVVPYEAASTLVGACLFPAPDPGQPDAYRAAGCCTNATPHYLAAYVTYAATSSGSEAAQRRLRRRAARVARRLACPRSLALRRVSFPAAAGPRSNGSRLAAGSSAGSICSTASRGSAPADPASARASTGSHTAASPSSGTACASICSAAAPSRSSNSEESSRLGVEPRNCALRLSRADAMLRGGVTCRWLITDPQG